MKLGAAFALLCVLPAAALSSASLELGPALGSLADALRAELLGRGVEDKAAEEEAARQRLQQEADRLAKEDGAAAKRAADLLRELARRGSQKEEEKAEPAPAASRSSSVSQSSEMTVVTDKDGARHVHRHVKNCRDGSCEERTEESTPEATVEGEAPTVYAAAEKGEKDGAEEEAKEAEEVRAVEEEAQNVARHVADMQKRMQKDFDVFQDISPAMSDDFWDRFHGSRERSGDDSALTRQVSEHSEATDSSESVSEETVVENGHGVHRVKRCKNGKCTEQVEELAPEELGEGAAGDEEAKGAPQAPARQAEW